MLMADKKRIEKPKLYEYDKILSSEIRGEGYSQ